LLAKGTGPEKSPETKKDTVQPAHWGLWLEYNKGRSCLTVDAPEEILMQSRKYYMHLIYRI